MFAGMRDGEAMLGHSSALLSPNTTNGPNGVTMNPEHHSTHQGTLSASTGGSNVPQSIAHNISEIDSASDDDVVMFPDGAVLLPMTASHAEQINAEMDIIDSEVMGTHNLAMIATENHLQPVPASDDYMVDYTDYAEFEQHESLSLDEDLMFGPDVQSWTGNDIHGGYIDQDAPLSNVPNGLTEVTQQLQHIQDGQDQTEVTTSTNHHGGNHDPSSYSIFSPPSTFLSPGGHSSHLGSGHTSISFQSPISSIPYTPDAPLHTGHWASIGNVAHVLYQVYEPDDNGSSDEDDIYNEESFDMGISDANYLQVEDQHNLSLGDFLFSWGYAASRNSSPKKKRRGPRLDSVNDLRASKPQRIRYDDLKGEKCDFQGIDWRKLEITRNEARKMRMATYKNYVNLKTPSWHPLTLRRSAIDNYEDFYKFKRMDFSHRITLAHFQLRNLVACTSRNNVFYAGESRVLQANSRLGQYTVRMDLSEPEVQATFATTWAGIQVSTIAADHNILLAGGFCGEYGMIPLNQPLAKHTEGLIIDNQNSITNHIQIHLNRQSGLAQAAIASNDCGLRILDCTTNRFVLEHKYDHPVNCSAISPDHRLRVIVGDTRNVMICNAETGDVLHALDGHVDYGFACAWADNGWHVATGNQDMLVKIWDARMWTDANGIGRPLQTIAAATAGVRSLKFSPLGSGKRVLVAAEPADVVSVIDAETFNSKQSLEFFGEITGVDFTPDGQDLFVGIHDSLRGGLMHFEKCGFGQRYGDEDIFIESNKLRRNNGSYENENDTGHMARGLDWKRTTQQVVADPRSMRTATYRRRKAALLGGMEPF